MKKVVQNRLKTRVIPPLTKDVVEFCCDLCGELLQHKEGVTTNPQHSRREETAIYVKQGDHFPGFSDIRCLSAQVCPECFRDSVVPALEAIGLTFTEEEIE